MQGVGVPEEEEDEGDPKGETMFEKRINQMLTSQCT